MHTKKPRLRGLSCFWSPECARRTAPEAFEETRISVTRMHTKSRRLRRLRIPDVWTPEVRQSPRLRRLSELGLRTPECTRRTCWRAAAACKPASAGAAERIAVSRAAAGVVSEPGVGWRRPQQTARRRPTGCGKNVSRRRGDRSLRPRSHPG
jgi:hypothetical protein